MNRAARLLAFRLPLGAGAAQKGGQAPCPRPCAWTPCRTRAKTVMSGIARRPAPAVGAAPARKTPGGTALGRAALLLALTLPSWAGAAPPLVAEDELRPKSGHECAARAVLGIIDKHHYRNKPLNDQLSSQVLDNYIKALDVNRSFFLQADVTRFERYRHGLDDALVRQELAPAFAIFRVYRRRAAERIDYALQLLEGEFDFSVNEEYLFDRREALWAGTQAEADEIWRKKVKNDYLLLKLAGKEAEEIQKTLQKRYARQKTNAFQLNANDIFQSFINAYTAAIEPHTQYFSPRSSENFDITMSLSLEGIGAVLRAEHEYTVVQRVVPGGPAELDGRLQAEDRVIGVGQERHGAITDVIGWRLDDVVDLIRGPKGSIVRLEVLPGDSGGAGPSRTIAITRDKIKLEEQAAKSQVIELDNGMRLGSVEIPAFYSDFAARARGKKDYRSTTVDVRKILAEMRGQDLDGLIVDLRGNGGGSLTEALELTGLFIRSGPIVQTRDSSGRVEVNRDPDPGLAYGGPLAVLVDRYSASASEIFAGAVQDYNRGIIIGEPTFGKGTVQNMAELKRFGWRTSKCRGRLKTTIAQFYRVSGGSTQHRGVVPDIIFPTARHSEDHGERSLDNALPWARIEPVRYTPVNAPANRFDHAREQHEERLRDNRLFQLLLDDLEASRAADEARTVTLLESRRRAEREELTATQRALRNELRLAQGLPPLPADANDAEETGEDDDEDDAPDILLNETARILADLIVPF